MRIIEQIQALAPDLADQFLIDGDQGTRAVKYQDLLNSVNKEIGWQSMYGDLLPARVRRNIYRGKNLGTQVSQDQWNEIKEGTFRNLFIGDYWHIDGEFWRIADFDYWWRSGKSGAMTEAHHVLIFPDHLFGSAYVKMYDTNTNAGGYVGSKVYTEIIPSFNSYIKQVFGSSHILNHQEMLCNAVTTNGAFGIIETMEDAIIPNEIMLYGCRIVSAPSYTESGSVYNAKAETYETYQMSIARLYPDVRYSWKLGSAYGGREVYWLNDPIGNASFAAFGYAGYAVSALSTHPTCGVRPVFAIKGGD